MTSSSGPSPGLTNPALEAIYPKADAFLGEQSQPDEIACAGGLIATLEQKIGGDYKPGTARRDAHPKAHGCVTATLNIRDDLPPELTGGVFQPGASYQAVVRFSNGSPNATAPDIKGGTRGMAVKLFGVPGRKLMADPGNPDVQDFIMMSSPFFFINSARDYARFRDAVHSRKIPQILQMPFYLGLRGSLNAIRMLRQKIANPLQTRYWSVVPSQLGTGDARQAVKFSARPIGPTHGTIPAKPGPNFLRAAMARTLAAGAYKMEFLIQRRGDTDLSVEDCVREWPETRAPFESVGILTIHQQNFDTHERDTYCENQSFNPWHSLKAHRPLGAINRTRRVVYQAISELRHGMDDTTVPAGLPADKAGSAGTAGRPSRASQRCD